MILWVVHIPLTKNDLSSFHFVGMALRILFLSPISPILSNKQIACVNTHCDNYQCLITLCNNFKITFVTYPLAASNTEKGCTLQRNAHPLNEII